MKVHSIYCPSNEANLQLFWIAKILIFNKYSTKISQTLNLYSGSREKLKKNIIVLEDEIVNLDSKVQKNVFLNLFIYFLTL